jgi:hypothetical protein
MTCRPHRKPLIHALVLASALLGLAGTVSPAQAHHSFAMFDRSKQVPLKGVVRQFQWTNPHIFVELAVQDGKGAVENWSIEGASPNMLFRQGWTFQTFHPGDQVTVTINPLKDGSRGGTLVSAVLPSGKTLGESAARAPG